MSSDPLPPDGDPPLGPQYITDPMPAEPRRVRLPHPGFWFSLLWCVVFFVVMLLSLCGGAAVAFLIQAAASGDVKAFTDRELKQMEPAGKGGGNAGNPAAGIADGEPEPTDAKLGPGMSYALAWGMVAGYAGGGLLTLLLLRVFVGREWPRKIALRAPRPAHLAWAVVSLPGFVVLANGFAQLLTSLGDGNGADGGDWMKEQAKSLEAMLTTIPAWLAVLAIGVGPGIVEELFSRGFQGRGLVARYGYVGGVFLTSMFFGLLHVYPPVYVLTTAVMGLWLHFTYLMTRSLWVPIALHLINNSFAALEAGGHITATAHLEKLAGWQAALVFVSAGVLMAGVAGVLWGNRLRAVAVGEHAESFPYPTVGYPPADSGIGFVTRPPHPLAAAAAVLGLVGMLVAVFV